MARIIRKALDWIGDASTLQSIASSLWPKGIAVVTTAMAAAWAWFINMPGPVIATIAMVMITCMLISINEIDKWKIRNRTKKERIAIKSDHGVIEDRKYIIRLSDVLTNYAPLQRAEVAMIYSKIENSKSLVWRDQNINQLRKDFLNRCGIWIDYNKRAETREQDVEIRREIKELARKLDAALS